MESTEKTFRYTYILKNLGVVYLLFLALDVWLTFAQDGPIFFLFILFGVGVVGAIIYITTSVTISNEDVSGRTLTGVRILKWSEIGAIKSTNSSFKMINVDGDISIRVNSRLDGYMEIFRLLYQKRADLFEYDKHNPFSRSVSSNIATVTIQLFLLIVSIANLVLLILNMGNSYFHILFIFVGVGSIYTLINWFFSPQSITMHPNSLTVKYFHKTNLYSKDDIVSIYFGRALAIVNLKSNKRVTFSLSGFAQSPTVIYYVLQTWHPAAFVKLTNDLVARNY